VVGSAPLADLNTATVAQLIALPGIEECSDKVVAHHSQTKKK